MRGSNGEGIFRGKAVKADGHRAAHIARTNDGDGPAPLKRDLICLNGFHNQFFLQR